MIEKKYFLRNFWYYALPSQELKPNKLISKTLLGEPILFGRRPNGKIFAMRNLCPHRGIPLSFGRFDGQEIECCYHGWRFDCSGNCTAIPTLVEDQKVDLSLFNVEEYPVREVQGNIWIFMADEKNSIAPSDRDIPLIPHFGDRPANLLYKTTFPCYVDHAVLGLIDPAHAPFVHRSWWWRDAPELVEEVKAFDPTPYGFTMRRHKIVNVPTLYYLLGRDAETEIAFHLPSVRIEHLTIGRYTICNLTVVTPITEDETEVHTMLYWDAPLLTILKPILSPLMKIFLNQDRDVFTKQQIGLKFNPPLTLVKGADTQCQWYYRIKAEYAKATAEGRPFINPIQEQVLRWRC
ncbi:MAG: Rieske 2Fe-2S domain-containing protein [Chroococcales cyanobacterium]